MISQIDGKLAFTPKSASVWMSPHAAIVPDCEVAFFRRQGVTLRLQRRRRDSQWIKCICSAAETISRL